MSDPQVEDTNLADPEVSDSDNESESPSDTNREIQTEQQETGTPYREANDNMSDAPANPFASIFGSTTAVNDAVIVAGMNAHKSSDRKDMDEKTLTKVRASATAPLQDGAVFKVMTAMGTGGATGAENTDLETTEMALLYAANTHIYAKVKSRVKDFDMTSAALLYKVIDETASHPKDKYGGDPIDITNEVGTLSLEEVKEYSGDMMRFDLEDGVHRMNQQWLLKFIRNCVSDSIHTMVEPIFNELPVHQQNGAVYLKMVEELCFAVDDHVIESLIKFLENFGEGSGCKGYKGENINVIDHEIVPMAIRLEQLGKLPDESAKWVLKGLCKATNNEFRETFQTIFRLRNQTLLEVSASATSAKSALEWIKAYFTQAKTLYTSSVLRNKWLPHSKRNAHANAIVEGVTICWNCGKKGHRAPDCPDERDNETFQKNRKAFMESKKAAGGGNHQKGKKGGGGKSGDSGTQKPGGYTRSGFGSNGVMVTSDGQVYTHCKHGTATEGCGTNQTHSSKYHNEWKANKMSFKLPPTHPFMTASASTGKGSQGTDSGSIDSAVQSALAKMLAKLETASSDPDISGAAGLLKPLFQ